MSSLSEQKRQRLERLRIKAEKTAATAEQESTPLNQTDVQALLQDVRTYQIELEMQNDELFRAQQEAKAARNEFFNLYYDAPVGYATIDQYGRIFKANRRLGEMCQSDSTDVVGALIFDYIHSNDLKTFRGRFRAFFNKPEDKEIIFRLNRNDSELYVSMTGRFIQYSGKDLQEADKLLLVAFSDITQLKKSEIELQLAAKVFESSVEGILVTNEKAEIMRVNKAFTLVTGYEKEEVIGKTPTLLKSGQYHESFYADMWRQIKDKGLWQGEIVNKRKNGEVYVEWLSISAVKGIDNQVRHYVGIFSDITEKKLNTQQMQQLAYYDVLTGLPNRTLFFDRLKQSLIRAKRNKNSLALLFIDLDNFKELNDNYGHAEGDLLLQEVARRLKDSIRASDTLARLGGDEFTVVLSDFHDPDLLTVETSKVTKKILEILSKPFDLEQISYRVSASIGVSIYPQDGEVISELIKHADSAMYQAKNAGKNTVQFFSQKMFEAQHMRSALKSELHEALDNNEFRLYYQPQINLQNGKLVGFEALIRWFHPDRGTLVPGMFIPIAEDIGLINKIGEWVLRETLKQLRIWHDQGNPELKISVNISVKQILNEQLPVIIKKLLEEFHLAPEYLELEVTETAMLMISVETSKTLSSLKQLGIHISLDDFGTGYSSLVHIKHFPIDCLKIDRSFVEDIFYSIQDKSIVLASLSLANSLGIATVAEGVEKEDQLEFLKSNGCTHAQGYLISEPLSAEMAESFILEFKS